jgi:signal recognition particle receptor subunit beta
MINTANELKVILVGSVGAGKTTALNTLCEHKIVSAEARATELNVLKFKNSTTVSMEYGTLYLNDTKLHVYGTPGQKRFDFMADILSKSAHGLIIMINNAHEQPLTELAYFLDTHRERLKTMPVIVAVTHCESPHAHTALVEYHQYLRKLRLPCPVLRIDARKKNDLLNLMVRLSTEIESRIQLSSNLEIAA